MTNRDIAEASVHQPENRRSQLARVYRKLGIRTRAEA